MNDYVEITLSSGDKVKVDPEDYDRLNRFNWYAIKPHGNTKYAVRTERRKTIFMHRVILDALPGHDVDHMNHDGLDNRKRNLRLCSKSQNAANSKFHTNNTSGYRGVYYQKSAKKWRADVRVSNALHYLGLFDSREAAARERDKFSFASFASFASLNFPNLTK